MKYVEKPNLSTQSRGKPVNTARTYSPAIADAVNYSRWLSELLQPYLDGEILEVGVGHGAYVPFLHSFGRYTGIDIDADAIAALRLRYPNNSFEVADIASDAFAVRFGERFDSLVCMNVLEHLEDDVAALDSLVRSLRVGGTMAVVVPALPKLYNDLDRLAGHFRRYTRQRMVEIVAKTPLHLERLQYFNPVGGLGWYLNRFKTHSSLDADAINRQIALFDRLLVPASRRLSGMFATLFGQSLLAIGKRV